MSKLRLILIDNPLGLVFNNRIAKAGDVVTVDPDLAAELFKAKAARLMVRVKVTKPHLLGSRVCAAGDLVDVTADQAAGMLERNVASMAPIKITAKSLVIDGRTYSAGKTAAVSANQAIELITLGRAEFEGEAAYALSR